MLGIILVMITIIGQMDNAIKGFGKLCGSKLARPIIIKQISLKLNDMIQLEPI